jgi:hypothetical protein
VLAHWLKRRARLVRRTSQGDSSQVSAEDLRVVLGRLRNGATLLPGRVGLTTRRVELLSARGIVPYPVSARIGTLFQQRDDKNNS